MEGMPVWPGPWDIAAANGSCVRDPADRPSSGIAGSVAQTVRLSRRWPISTIVTIRQIRCFTAPLHKLQVSMESLQHSAWKVDPGTGNESGGQARKQPDPAECPAGNEPGL